MANSTHYVTVFDLCKFGFEPPRQEPNYGYNTDYVDDPDPNWNVHCITSNWRQDIDVDITSRNPNAPESCTILDNLIIKSRG